jgi:hypothetical protein
MKTSAGPKPTAAAPSKSRAPANPAAPMGSAKSPAPAGVAKAPGTTQPAGSRFRAPEAPSMAPRGTPSTPARRLDRTP